MRRLRPINWQKWLWCKRAYFALGKGIFRGGRKCLPDMGFIDNLKRFFRNVFGPKVDRTNEREYRAHLCKIWKKGKCFSDYLIEAEQFRTIFKKDVNCYVCGFECGCYAELYEWNGHLYCKKHLPYNQPTEGKKKE